MKIGVFKLNKKFFLIKTIAICVSLFLIYSLFIYGIRENTNNVATIQSVSIEKETPLQTNDKSYVVQSMTLSSKQGLNSKIIHNPKNNGILNYYLLKKQIKELDTHFLVNFKMEKPEDIYILGLVSNKLLKFNIDNSNANYFILRNNTNITGKLDVSLNIKLANKMDNGDLSFIALTSSDLKNSGSFIHFTTLSIVNKSIKTNFPAINLPIENETYLIKKYPIKIDRLSEDMDKVFLLSSKNQYTSNFDKATQLGINNISNNSMVSIILLNEEMEAISKPLLLKGLVDKRANIFNYKFPKKTKALLVIEEPTESKLLSRYNFIMGESTVPTSIGMFIGE